MSCSPLADRIDELVLDALAIVHVIETTGAAAEDVLLTQPALDAVPMVRHHVDSLTQQCAALRETLTAIRRTAQPDEATA